MTPNSVIDFVIPVTQPCYGKGMSVKSFAYDMFALSKVCMSWKSVAYIQKQELFPTVLKYFFGLKEFLFESFFFLSYFGSLIHWFTLRLPRKLTSYP